MNNLQNITINEDNTEFLYDNQEFVLELKDYNPQTELEELEKEGVNLDLYDNDEDALLNSLVMFPDSYFTKFFKNAKKITCCGDEIENAPEVYRCPTCKEAV